MGLFEFFFERRNPGPIGELATGPEPPGSRHDLVLRCVISAMLLGGWIFVLVNIATTPGGLGAGAFFTVVYLVVAYFLHPEPDSSNLGWFGGLMNNPFRFSDNVNRWLMFLSVVLWPGRMVSGTLMDLWRTVVR